MENSQKPKLLLKLIRENLCAKTYIVDLFCITNRDQTALEVHELELELQSIIGCIVVGCIFLLWKLLAG